MYVDYEYYSNECKGQLEQNDFNLLEPKVEDLVKLYMERFIAPWKYQETLEDYTDVDVRKAVCYQVDYLHECGGLSALNGTSDLDLTGVSQDGFSYTYGNTERGNKEFGIPFSSLAAQMIFTALRKAGYTNRRVDYLHD